ncbi:Hypothetical protein PHPALM_11541 [Phytophthora palmivora]|uniref:Uncharacterized protein n=1 Tax=Phytophthora palmivora TaxID=4796 RepID=A0A2P4Y1Z2_9STRA|nr:Hypothetical protein PHPALM_11541 [Phytophthora palmivora]
MAKHAAEAQLQDLKIKLNSVGHEVTLLQDEIKKLKVGQKVIANNENVQTSENERTTLHTLSVRLEEAMIQAKDVITFKDGVIESLEERLQLASKRGADAVAMLDAERGLFEREKNDLLGQLQQSKICWDSNKNEEVSKLKRENMVAQQQKAELTVKVAQLTLELETARSQWTQDVHDREDRVEKMCARQVAEAEQQLEQNTAAMQQQMTQFRSELDMKVARQRVATQAACKAGELKCDQLERDLQRMKLKLSKQKIKMEKKARVLMTSTRKQHEVDVAALKHELADLSERMKIVLEREQGVLSQAKKSEEVVERLRTELKASAVELEQERARLENLFKKTEHDKSALKADIELQLREMEESLAKRIGEAELRVHEERDGQVRKLMDQHNAEKFCRIPSPHNRDKKTKNGSDKYKQEIPFMTDEYKQTEKKKESRAVEEEAEEEVLLLDEEKEKTKGGYAAAR